MEVTCRSHGILCPFQWGNLIERIRLQCKYRACKLNNSDVEIRIPAAIYPRSYSGDFYCFRILFAFELDFTSRILLTDSFLLLAACLKIRSPKEIASLEFPSSAKPKYPIKNVVYKSDNSESHIEGDSIQSLQNKEATRFNLFTGYQTLREREETFEVQF